MMVQPAKFVVIFLLYAKKKNGITIGDNDGPAHMHVNSEMIKSAEFIQEQKPDKISFSVQIFR